ncbi:alpha/beta fold hydrolase [Pseudalkalibacillus decolorationis]|uniref:alpha/beta fold hydrolase n=1 Tax=Pseudalkalibacillus decolorationis TaxID=163879 RepID=UPI002148C2E5|nr:alpha/beta hydrolase [Pseudalkalibacillus decolorationis]
MGKEPLVLLPGTLCDDRLWAHQIRNLSDIADVKVGDLTKDDSVEGMARSVLDNAPDRFALAGLSLGGIVAMEVIRQAPERVWKLALLDSNPYAPKPEQLKTWDNFVSMVEKGRFSEITENHLLPNLIHSERLGHNELTSMIINMSEHIGPEAYIRQLMAVKTRTNACERLKDIQCPTLLLVGQEDRVCPVELHEQMADLIPNSKLVVVEHCGHLSSLEQPEHVTCALQGWLLAHQ